MKYRRILLAVVSCSLLFAGPAWSSTDANHEVVELRRIILEHAAQFQSFQGKYRLSQETDSGLWAPVFECRVQGKNMYADMQVDNTRRIDGEPAWDREIYTRWEGIISTRFERADHSPQIMLNNEGWMAPDMAYLDPTVLFLTLYGKTAEAWLSKGTDTVHRRENMRVLSHMMPSCACSYDVYIDEENHIRRLEYAMRLLEPEEELKKYWTGDLFDIRRVERSWAFDAWSIVDGVNCPCLVTAIWYAHDNALSEKLWGMRDRNEITGTEAWVRNYVENPETVSSVQTFEFVEPEIIVFNEPLSKEDFALAAPVGAKVRDVASRFSYRVKPKRWYQRIPTDTWLGIGLVFFIIVITFSGWGVWRRYA